MSGGAYNYFSIQLSECLKEIKLKHPTSKLHLKFIELMENASEVFHTIEWADSGDIDQKDAKEVLDCFLTDYIKKFDCKDCSILKSIKGMIE